MEQGKVIGNVNVLDLRKATEASIATISRIGNVNVLVYSRETADLITRLNTGNITATVEAPSDANVRTLMGQVVINRDYFKNQEAAPFLLVMGQVVVEPDVPVEDIESGLGGLVVMGQLVCPEHLAGAIQSKIRQVMGQTMIYPPFARVKLGSLDLDEHYLRALDDETELAVVGSLRVPQVLPNDLLEQKIQKLFVSGGIKCHEENAQAIQARLVAGSGEIKAIPAGFELVQRPLVLDGSLLESLPASKLYCTERVQVEGDVTSSALDEHLDGLVSEEMILCPAALRDVLSRKCNLLENRVVFYEGELWLVDDAHDLRASRFDYLEGKATLVVTGELRVDREVDPAVLADRLAKVHNLGTIWCTPEQMGAIEARLGQRDGRLMDSTPREEAEEEPGTEHQIGNANYLAL
jgi:hypothetical protein